MGVGRSKDGVFYWKKVSVYIITVSNIPQFATWGGSGKSMIKGYLPEEQNTLSAVANCNCTKFSGKSYSMYHFRNTLKWIFKHNYGKIM